jgi:hypothetical protein
MRLIKILGLSTGLGLLAMALVGASPAPAVVICMEEGNAAKTCPEGKRYLAREYKGKLEGSAIMKGELGREVTCTASTFTMEVTTSPASPLPGEVSSVTFGGCSGCSTANVLNLNYDLSITSIGDNRKDGDLIVTKQSGQPQIEFTGCFGTMGKCVFGAAEQKIALEFKGGPGAPGAKAKIVASEEPFQYVSGGEMLCGKTAKFTATYELIEPTAAWVVLFPTT